MNVDSLFLKGRSHLNCEDYAIAQKIDDHRAYLIVADGCSSGRRSDVAARIVASVAERVIINDWRVLSALSAQEAGRALLNRVVYQIVQAFDLVRLFPPSSLLSTLVVATIDPEKIRIFNYGDGVSVLHREDDTISFRSISYEREAPRYPAYALDPDLERAYLSEMGRQAVKIETVLKSSDGSLDVRFGHSTEASEDIIRHGLPLEVATSGVRSLVLASDGLGTFYDDGEFEGDGGEVLADSFATQLVGFKTRGGQFLRRRITKMVSDLDAAHTRFEDDLGLAAVTFLK